jgi:hypothetical protein
MEEMMKIVIENNIILMNGALEQKNKILESKVISKSK